MLSIMKKLILFLFFALSFSVEVRPISQMPFDLNSSDLVYGRGTYLIVLPNQSIESYITNENFGGDFVKFKKTQGFDVEFVYYDQVATNAQELKNHIMDYYSINPMLEYVLLVGDVNGPYTIPTFTINSYNEEDINVTDYPYTFQDDSYDAKFFLGRWTVRSVVDLINVKSRSIQYVKNDYVDKQIYNNALLVAGNYKTAEGSEVPPNEWPVTPVWTSLWLMEELNNFGYAQIDTAFFHAGNYETGEFNPEIANVWNDGVGVINYRGWGDANGWHKPYFHRENVDDLSNGWRLPVVMSFVCNTGDFGNDYSGTGLAKCFGEVLITGGTVASPRGATAVVGPSDLDTDTRFNNVICGVMWDALLEGDAPELAQALHYGKRSLSYEFSGLSAPDGTVIDEFYHHVYGVLGDPSLPVTLKEPENIIIETMLSDDTIEGNFVCVHVSDSSNQPLDGVVGALLDENDNLIGKGVSYAESLDSDAALCVEFNSNDVVQNSTLTLYVNKAQYNQNMIALTFIGDDGLSDSPFIPIPIAASVVSNTLLVPGILNNLSIEYYNPSSQALDLQLELYSGEYSFVSGYGLALPPFGSEIVNIDIDIPSDLEIGSDFEIVSSFSEMESATDWETSNIFVVSDSADNYSASNPTYGSHGYWAYDIGDSGFFTNVDYDWEEINSVGDNLGLTDDTITTIDLPFDFKYFGETYSAGTPLTVCSNGWVSFEPTQLDYFWNFSIPNPLGPSAMVAPFMDDLDDNGGAVPFNVYYKSYDDRFIVQWDGVLNGEDDQNCPNCIDETFQVIFYNEAYHETQTGDGQIKFQYKEVHDIDANGNYSTIGVESPDQDAGLQYLFSLNRALGANWDQDNDGVVNDFAIVITTNSPSYSGGGGDLCAPYDVNIDGSVNVVDIVNLVNIIFGAPALTDEQECAADTNGDSVINVVDIVTLVNYILNL